MHRAITLTRLLIFVPVALLSLFAPVALADNNLLSNPTFSSGGGSWIGAAPNNCWGGYPSLGYWSENSLAFSYMTRTVTQTVVVSQPSNLLFSVDVIGRHEPYIFGQYVVSLSSETASTSTGLATATPVQNSIFLELATTSVNEIVTVSITGDDGPTIFWAGCYGPLFTNASLSVVSEIEPETTTTSEVTTTTIEETTTTTSEPPQTTLPPETTAPTVPPAPSSSVPSSSTSSTSTLPLQTTTTVEEQSQEQTTTTAALQQNTTTTILITEEISAAEALLIISDSEYLLSLDANELENIFQSINIDELTDEQSQEILLALQDAPDEVKEVFENEINVFAGQFDSYVPVGSSISVAERRIVIAAGAVLSASASIATPTNSQSGRRRAT